MARNKKTLMVLSIFFVLFVFGVVQLFHLRFEAGDVYPKYSSLRSDPLGVKALYDAFDDLASVSVSRNYQPLTELSNRPGATLFYFGTHEWEMSNVPDDLAETLESFVGRGGRLVISFLPLTEKPWKDTADEEEGDENPTENGQENNIEKKAKKESSENRDEDSPDSPIRFVSLPDRWGFDLNFAELAKGSASTYASLVAEEDTGALPGSISWHTGLFFDAIDPVWRVIYERAKRPVIIERPFEQGSIVLTADSYFLSNEAMRWERHPPLLAWLVKPNREIIFEETHHGVRETSGIMALARKYRLHGLFVWSLLLAALFIWRNSSPFVPPLEDDSPEKESVPILGRDSFAGFINLLRRTVSARDILAVCFGQWKDSYARPEKKFVGKLETAQQIVDREKARPAHQSDPVRTYQHVRHILAGGGKGQ